MKAKTNKWWINKSVEKAFKEARKKVCGECSNEQFCRTTGNSCEEFSARIDNLMGVA